MKGKYLALYQPHSLYSYPFTFEAVLRISTVCVCVYIYIYIYAEMLEETEETSGTLIVRNKTEKIIITYYVMDNVSSNRIYLWRLANIAEYSVPCLRE